MQRSTTPVTFAALALMLVLSGLDQTILSTALPTMMASLGGRELAPWVFSAYLLASTAVIPLYGKLADRLGVRPLLLASTTLFALGSLACAVAGSMPWLVAARALQGLGGGGLMTLTMLATAALYPMPERGRRMGLLGAAYGVSTLVGPLGGALLLQLASWHWAFLLNIPGTLLALWVLARADLGTPPRAAAPMDWTGAGLLAAALVLLLLATREGGGTVAGLHGWLLPAGSALVLLAAWAWVERRAADPVVPLDLFRRRPFVAVSLLSALSGVMLFATVVFVPLLLQQGLGLSPTASALSTLPLMLGITVAGQLAGRALRAGVPLGRIGSLAASGLTLGFAALAAVLHWVPSHGAGATQVGVALALAPVGLGLGLLFPLVSVVAQRSAPPQHLGVATAMPVMLRALGGALGVAVLGEFLHGHMAQAMAHGLHSPADALRALADGTASIALWAGAAAVLSLLVARWLPRPQPGLNPA